MELSDDQKKLLLFAIIAIIVIIIIIIVIIVIVKRNKKKSTPRESGIKRCYKQNVNNPREWNIEDKITTEKECEAKNKCDTNKNECYAWDDEFGIVHVRIKEYDQMVALRDPKRHAIPIIK